MAAPFFFKDFGKNASDLLSKDIPSNQQVKLTTANVLISNSKAVFTGKTNNDRFAGSVEFTTNVEKVKNTEVKMNVNTAGNANVSLSNDKLAKGLKISTRFDADFSSSSFESKSLEASAEYKHKDSAAVSGKVVFPSGSSNAVVDVNAVLFKNRWAFGVACVGGVEENFNLGSNDVSAGVQYSDFDFVSSAVLQRNNEGQLSGVLSHYRFGSVHSVGTEFKVNHTTGKSSAGVAVQKKLANGALSKIVLRSSGDVGVSYKKNLDADADVILGGTFNTNNRTYSVGFNVNINV